VCSQRQTIDEQSGKQTKMTSVWHPIIGHVRGKTSGITVSNQEIVQRVIIQYKFLWSKSFVNMLFESIPTTSSGNQSSSIAKKETSKSISFFLGLTMEVSETAKTLLS
ncbi:unnamed protein product, partial [Rotaria sordida]